MSHIHAVKFNGRFRAITFFINFSVPFTRQDEARRSEVPVAAGEEPLHVVQLGGRVHSACSQRSVATPRPGSPRRPARTRSLLAMLALVSRPYAEYHTSVGTWCRRR